MNISKTKKDIPKRKMPFFFTLKSLSNRQQLFFYFISTSSNFLFPSKTRPAKRSVVRGQPTSREENICVKNTNPNTLATLTDANRRHVGDTKIVIILWTRDRCSATQIKALLYQVWWVTRLVTLGLNTLLLARLSCNPEFNWM